MIDAAILQGRWNEIKGNLIQHWGELSDDDLAKFKGNVNQLVGLIQRKTGESGKAIRKHLEQLTDDVTSVANDALEAGREGVNRSAVSAGAVAERISGRVSERLGDAEDFVRERPSETLAIVFGAGVCLGLFLRSLVRSS